MLTVKYPPRTQWPALSQRPTISFEAIREKVAPILKRVQKQGDQAILRFTRDFDDVALDTLRVPVSACETAQKRLSHQLKDAIALASANIKKFHEAQREVFKQVETAPGVMCWRKSVAINRVGFYIPGGSAPLFSTVLMLAIPARIAGCKEIILCTPPGADGAIHPAILYCAHELGIESIFQIGGAQAIAAMAYGTESVPRVDKIFGPGNQYVTAAKQIVSSEGIAIDMPAGPTELAVIADATCRPRFVAADLLSQAEHGPDSQVLLLCNEEDTCIAIQKELAIQIKSLPRADIAQQAIANSRAIVLESLDAALEFANAYAPEHLVIASDDAQKWAGKVENAGSVFLGHFAPESVGDYASGTNHTLPTNGFARAYSGVSLDSFIKKITFQQLSEAGLQRIGPAVETMAEAEQLHGHKRAVSIRLGTF